MTFRIIGDEIEFQQRTIGRFTVPSFDTWRNRATDLLEDMDPDRIEREQDEALKEIEDAYKDEITERNNKISDLKDRINTLESLIEEADDKDGLLGKFKAALADAQEWRETAQRLQKTLHKLTTGAAPAPRKRRPA